MVAIMSIGQISYAGAATSLFSDVSSTHTYYDDICWAVENGIISRYYGKFAPDERATVEQFFADAFCYYVQHGIVRADLSGGDVYKQIRSQQYFDNLAKDGRL